MSIRPESKNYSNFATFEKSSIVRAFFGRSKWLLPSSHVLRFRSVSDSPF
jgi:hypothetical protein